MYSEIENKEEIKQSKEPFFHHRTKRIFANSVDVLESFTILCNVHSVLFILLGLLSTIYFSLSNGTIKVLFFLILLFYSVLHFYYFMKRRECAFLKSSLFYAVANFILGAVVLFTSSLLYQQILVFLGLHFLFIAIERMWYGFFLIRSRDKQVLVFGVQILLFILMSILLFINPFLTLYFGEIVGVFSILFGILNISSLSFAKKKIDQVLSFFD